MEKEQQLIAKMRQKMKSEGISVTQMAKDLKYNRSYLSQLFLGYRRIYLHQWILFSNYLNIDLEGNDRTGPENDN